MVLGQAGMGYSSVQLTMTLPPSLLFFSGVCVGGAEVEDKMSY